MLFKKPFAFLIKYFKVIHFILTIMITYLLLKTDSIFRFIGEYMNSSVSTIGTNVTSTLFKPIIIVMIIGVLVLTFIILGLMSFKKKPVRFYIFNIITYGFVTFVFLFSYANIKTLEIGYLDIRTLKLMRDFCLVSLILQSLSVITVGIRATGFNIKKFDFDEDLEDLKITSEDNEEFEIDVELDTDQLKRSFRKKIRHARYVYIENKFMIHMISLLVIALACFIIYLNVGVYHKVYKQNEPFSTSEFMLNIKNSYITTSDYHGNTITDSSKLLVIQYEVRNLRDVNKKTFSPERFSLLVSNQSFRSTNQYRDELEDLGNEYKNEYITTTFQEYILVYELPANIDTNHISLTYLDNNKKTIEISIHPIDDRQKELIDYQIGQEIVLKQGSLKDSKLKIEGYEIADSFVNQYTYCVSESCYIGVEYILPSMSGNYDKALLKLYGNFILNETSKNTKVSDLYLLLQNFGTITYQINGEDKTVRNFKQVKPTRNNENNIYYIEVPKELIYAEQITLSLTFRETKYEIAVK